jgi:hypothetical protein
MFEPNVPACIYGIFMFSGGSMSAALWMALCFLTSTGAAIDYSIYDKLTKRYIDDRGLVDYGGLKKELPVMRRFVDQLATVSPENQPALFRDDEALRYYLTAYNAWVLYIATSEYPSKRSLWRFGLFRNRDIRLGGRPSSLNELEHEILRKRFRDPRIHFYINCAAISCPPLFRGAIPKEGTAEALEEAARRFINDPSHVRYDAKNSVLYLSKIFDWFEKDFIEYLKCDRGIAEPRISQYIALYLDAPAGSSLSDANSRKLKVRYLKYDKSLNDQARQ